MTAGFPHGGVHEDGGVDTHNVAVQQHHALPPILLDVIFQFHAVLAIVVDGGQAVVDVTAGENETIFLTVTHYLFENIFLCHNNL